MNKTTTTETMEQARHTPGPWKHEYGGLIYAESHPGSPVCKASGPDLHGRSQAECLANSNLIASAPELYEFAKRIDELIRQGRPSDHLWNYCVEHREGVIARAEGGAS